MSVLPVGRCVGSLNLVTVAEDAETAGRVDALLQGGVNGATCGIMVR